MSEKRCFVISPIGEPDSESRKRSDQVLKHIIAPAVEKCGYNAVRADQISEPGMITSQVIQHVVDDELVVADLTERNPNVFYELAIRHAIRKPLVQIIKRGEQIPFDVAGTRTIHVDHHDLDSVEEAKVAIESQINSLEKDSSTLETPISVSLDLQLLRQSDNPEERSLADVLSAVTEIRSGLSGIEKRLDSKNVVFNTNFMNEIMEFIEVKSMRDRHLDDQLGFILDEMGELVEELSSMVPTNSREKFVLKNRIDNIKRMKDHISLTLK